MQQREQNFRREGKEGRERDCKSELAGVRHSSRRNALLLPKTSLKAWDGMTCSDSQDSGLSPCSP